ncbi:MAG: glycosyltransferase [Micrococcales bacterium]
MAIAAVVVHHNQPQLARATCLAVNQQSVAPDHKILVNIGVASEPTVEFELTPTSEWFVVNLSDRAGLDQAIDAALQELGPQFRAGDQNWLWLLHDDSTPEQDALAELIVTLETAPSAALIGPKLVRRDQPRIIQQLGLTATKTGAIFVPVRNELDQSQHDHLQESLAISTAGALISVAKYLEVEGLSGRLNPLAADLDLGVRLRLAGYRVLVSPRARVRHDALSLAGERPRYWLGGKPETAVLKAQIQLRFRFAPLWLAVLYALALPLLAVVQSAVLLLAKHPERVWNIWASSLWGFFTAPFQFTRVRGLSADQRRGLRALRPLLAGRDQISRAKRARLAPENWVAQSYPSVTSSPEITGEPRASFFAVGGLWIMAGLAVLSWNFWPANSAVTGGGLLPLSETWPQLFERAGSSWQRFGSFAAPSDPFNWVLLALGSITFLKPSLALTWFVFLVKPLAFLGAFRVMAQTGAKSWLAALGALGYAFLPSISQAQISGQLPQLVALVLLPWFVYVLSKLLNFGDAKVQGVQTWSWLGTAGLLAAAISASAPSFTPVAAAAVLVLASYRFRKLGYLIWLPIPLLVLWAPSIWYFSTSQPLALLTDPGASVAASHQEYWRLMLGGQTGLAFAQYSVWVFGAIALVALTGLVSKRFGSILLLWIAALVALAAAYLVQSIQFPVSGNSLGNQTWVSGSPLVLTGVAGLVLLVASVLAIQSAPRSLAWLGGWLVGLAALTLAVQFTLSAPTNLSYNDGRQAPAIVAAQAKLNPQLRVLVLQPSSSGRLTASLVPGAGIALDDLSVAYRYALPGFMHKLVPYTKLAELSADLASANGNDLSAQLKQANIGYVLVPPSPQAAELANSLDSVKELEAVGVTQFGQLWRVTLPQDPVATTDSAKLAESKLWSLTKGVQLATIVVFGLLALPTRRRGSRAANASDGSTHDLFEVEEASQ